MAPERRMVKRTDSVRDISPSDLIDWCVQRDISPWDATISAAHIKWESEQTDEEHERYEKWAAERAEATERWERGTLERLLEKYGLPGARR